MSIFGDKKDKVDPVKEELAEVKKSVNNLLTAQMSLEERLLKIAQSGSVADLPNILYSYKTAIENLDVRVSALERIVSPSPQTSIKPIHSEQTKKGDKSE